MVEFTVPWEERTEEFHESKKGQVPRSGRLMKGKLLENSGISSSDLLAFSISISFENAHDISGRE